MDRRQFLAALSAPVVASAVMVQSNPPFWGLRVEEGFEFSHLSLAQSAVKDPLCMYPPGVYAVFENPDGRQHWLEYIKNESAIYFNYRLPVELLPPGDRGHAPTHIWYDSYSSSRR